LFLALFWRRNSIPIAKANAELPVRSTREALQQQQGKIEVRPSAIDLRSFSHLLAATLKPCAAGQSDTVGTLMQRTLKPALPS
jgi:hypothetical protein